MKPPEALGAPLDTSHDSPYTLELVVLQRGNDRMNFLTLKKFLLWLAQPVLGVGLVQHAVQRIEPWSLPLPNQVL